MEKVMEYVKIPNIYQRDSETKKLIEGVYSSPELVYLENCKWNFTEKVDGTNVRVIWDGYRVEFRGRTDKASLPKHLMKRLEELFGGVDNEELFEQTFGKKNVIIFGEGYGEKIQNGELYGPVNFIVFDIYIDSFWLRRQDVLELANKFGVSCVPTALVGTLKDGVKFIKTHPHSVLKCDTMEGIVGRPGVPMFDRNGNRIMVKIKCRDF